MQYYSLQSLWAAGIALLVCILMGPVMIPFLTRLKVGQSIRDDGPQSHQVKAGTPTMGGLMIITAVMIGTFIVAGSSPEALSAVMVMVAFGAIGFWDDYIKVVLKRSLGLRAREKLVLQFVVGLFFGILLVTFFGRGTSIIIPFTGTSFDLGYFYYPFLILVLMGTANGVNLTDGLDGLAAGVTFFAALGYALVAMMTTHFSLLAFCAALGGARLGFLVYNHFPARVFMGDTGSMALGGALAAVAAITRTEIALILIGGVYVVETLSVILQVISFQTTGKRIFLMSPLHHHFELKGWSEPRVVRTFWLLSFLFVLLGLWGLKGTGI